MNELKDMLKERVIELKVSKATVELMLDMANELKVVMSADPTVEPSLILELDNEISTMNENLIELTAKLNVGEMLLSVQDQAANVPLN